MFGEPRGPSRPPETPKEKPASEKEAWKPIPLDQLLKNPQSLLDYIREKNPGRLDANSSPEQVNETFKAFLLANGYVEADLIEDGETALETTTHRTLLQDGDTGYDQTWRTTYSLSAYNSYTPFQNLGESQETNPGGGERVNGITFNISVEQQGDHAPHKFSIGAHKSTDY